VTITSTAHTTSYRMTTKQLARNTVTCAISAQFFWSPYTFQCDTKWLLFQKMKWIHYKWNVFTDFYSDCPYISRKKYYLLYSLNLNFIFIHFNLFTFIQILIKHSDHPILRLSSKPRPNIVLKCFCFICEHDPIEHFVRLLALTWGILTCQILPRMLVGVIVLYFFMEVITWMGQSLVLGVSWYL